MRRLLACIVKDALLLWRDKTALAVLFVMPVAMVFLITLMFAWAMELTGDVPNRIVLVDEDGGGLARTLVEQLHASGYTDIATDLDGRRADADRMKAAVARGSFQIGLVIPAGTMRGMKDQARSAMAGALQIGQFPSTQAAAMPLILMYFDPAIQGYGRIITQSVLERITLDIELKEKMAALSELLPARINATIAGAMGDTGAPPRDFLAGVKVLPEDWAKESLAGVEERQAFESDLAKKPNSNQHSVPAWTLFGMFFIVIPLSGSLILERSSGTLLRLIVSPVPDIVLLAGKALVYLTVCMTQFVLILGLGKAVFPRLGAGSLETGSAPFSLVAVALCASCAAIGFGILMGTAARTFQQASAIGPIAIVIASALGGILVPAFIMPRIMQQVCAFSPMGWGLRAFQEIFVRGGTVRTAWPWMVYLLAFAAACTMVGWILLHRRRRFGAAEA